MIKQNLCRLEENLDGCLTASNEHQALLLCDILTPAGHLSLLTNVQSQD